MPFPPVTELTWSVTVPVASVGGLQYTTISITLQAYATGPNGSGGIRWDLHINVEEKKFLFLYMKPRNEVNVFALMNGGVPL